MSIAFLLMFTSGTQVRVNGQILPSVTDKKRLTCGKSSVNLDVRRKNEVLFCMVKPKFGKFSVWAKVID